MNHPNQRRPGHPCHGLDPPVAKHRRPRTSAPPGNLGDLFSKT